MRRVGIATALATFSLAAPALGAGDGYPSPGVPPPGTNDFSCVPPKAHPSPVVLVHGTFADMTISWNLIAPALEQQGYCVFALDYGGRGAGPIAKSAHELKRFVDKVLEATGAKRVSMIGHSQGGMMPRYYLRFLGGANRVDDLIGLAPSNHGTTTPLARAVGPGCRACLQQVAGSDFIERLNAGDETFGRVSYTVVETSHDEVVTPFSSAFLHPGPRTTNVLLQDDCPLDPFEHVSIIYDPVALQWIENALGRAGSADPGFKPTCAP
jgi:triacylglycerol lipase